MGSGDWLKNIISSKKEKDNKHLKSNGVKQKDNLQKEPTKLSNGATNRKKKFVNLPPEGVAAIRIQTAFRAYRARKSLRRLKGIARLQSLIQKQTVSKQASTTLDHLHSWSRIQSEITARRHSMVTEGRLRQKKLENQLKLEAKLHDLEVEWSGGSETMEETLSRIHHREEAALKRERALAYAFSHQWKANSSLFPGPPELAKANWGWSWTERWIAAQPWENRVLLHSSPKKTQIRTTIKTAKNTPLKTPVSVKAISPSGKGPKGARKLTYPANGKSSPKGNIKAEEAIVQEVQVTSRNP